MRKPTARTGCGLVLAAAAAAMLAAGCQGPHAMQGAFIEYSAAYAETSNQQMLLNLARAANSHPIYFLQMGSINSTFQFGMNGGGNAGQTRSRGPNPYTGVQGLTDTMTLGGTLGFSLSEQPTFGFTPLSGTSFGTAIFNPIDPRIFFNLFNQGWPADQLFRVMVASVTISDDKGTRTLSNVIDPERAHNYRNFLTFSAIVRELQKKRMLTTTSNNTTFAMSAKGLPYIAELMQDPTYRYESEQEDYTEAPKPKETASGKTAGEHHFSLGLELRTFSGVMDALANEERIFDFLSAKEKASFLQKLPAIERQPVLRIRPEKGQKLTPAVVSVNYRGDRYAIADRNVDDPSTEWVEVSTWNRNVFDLLCKLYVQISIDPSKLPVQQLIQIH